MKLKHLFLFLTVLGVVCVGVWLVSPPNPPPKERKIPAKTDRSRIKKRATVTLEDIKARRLVSPTNQRPHADRKMRDRKSLPDEFSPEERACVEAMEEAANAEDFNAVLTASRGLASSTNPAVRLSVVESLGWFGKQALPELTPFLADPDEDIRSSAHDQWFAGLADIDDPIDKGDIIEATMNIITDLDTLEDLTHELNDIPPTQAVNILVTLIENGKEDDPAVAAAQDAYDFITGEQYEGLAKAQAWVDENPDDDDDDDDD